MDEKHYRLAVTSGIDGRPRVLDDHVVLGRRQYDNLASLADRAINKLAQLKQLRVELGDKSSAETKAFISCLCWLLGESEF